MLFVVSDNFKGELHIPILKKTFASGRSFVIPDEHSCDPVIQKCLKLGFITLLDEGDSQNFSNDEFLFVNSSNNSLSIKSLNRSVEAGAKIYINSNDLNNRDISNAITLKLLTQVKEDKNIEVEINEIDSNKKMFKQIPSSGEVEVVDINLNKGAENKNTENEKPARSKKRSARKKEEENLDISMPKINNKVKTERKRVRRISNEEVK